MGFSRGKMVQKISARSSVALRDRNAFRGAAMVQNGFKAEKATRFIVAFETSQYLCFLFGADGESRTPKVFPPHEPESCASASSATSAFLSKSIAVLKSQRSALPPPYRAQLGRARLKNEPESSSSANSAKSAYSAVQTSIGRGRS